MRRSILTAFAVVSACFAGCNGTTATTTSTSGGGTSSGGATTGGVTSTGGASATATSTGGGVGDFSLSLTPINLMLTANGNGTVAVNIDRSPNGSSIVDSESIAFSATVSPAVDGDGSIVTTFNPTSTTIGSVQATVMLTPPVAAGSYTVTLSGLGATSALTHTASLALTATAPVTTLLIDNDGSDNNDPTNTNPVPSTDDTLFPTLLTNAGIGFATQVINRDGSSASVPSVTTLADYQTAIWYTGNDSASGDNATITSAQETALEDWLNVGGKTLIIFSAKMLGDLNYGAWAGPPTDVFVSNYLGLGGGDFNPHSVTYASGNSICDGATSFVVTGVAATSFAGQAFQVVRGTATVDDDTSCGSVLNPASGTATLATLPTQDPSTATPTTDAPAAIMTLNPTAGTGTTKSQVVYVGFEIGDLSVNPLSTPAELDASALFTSVLNALE